MSTTVKIVLGILAACLAAGLALSALAWAAFRGGFRGAGLAVNASRSRAAEVATNIAAFDLPVGFEPALSVEVAGFALAGFNGADGRSHIYFAKAPNSVKIGPKRLEDYVKEQTGQGLSELQQTGSFEVSIHGEAVQVYVADGVSHDGASFRTATAAFPAEDGLALVTLSRPASLWDETGVQRFFESLE